MPKLVVLKITGNGAKGFDIILEISPNISSPQIETIGHLPPNPDLFNQNKAHWEKYRFLGAPYRIKARKIIRENEENHHQSIINCQNSATELSHNFNQWLQSPQFHHINNKLRENLNPSEEIRILLRTEDNDIRKLPWQEWEVLQSYSQAEIAFSSLQSVAQFPTINKTKNKVRILAILGHKQGIDINQDQQILEKLPHAEIKFLVEPEKKEINDQLWEQNWDIIFFAGHSETEGEIGRIYINSLPNIWENSLTIDELWYGLRKAVENGLQLAIFNSCDGLGLSQKINDLIIPQMIIMRELVPDQVAQEFLKYFLLEYAKGKSLYLAVKEGKERLKILKDQFPCANWLPIIFQHPQIIPPTWSDLRKKSFFESIYSLPINKYKLGIGIFVFLGMLSSYLIIMPKISDELNKKGVEYYQKSDLNQAQKYFVIALKINPQNANAMNNLGNIYLDLSEFNLAREQFRKATKLGNMWGCNSAAYMDIQEQKYDQAEYKLRPCLSYMKTQKDSMGIYLMLKNLAWVLRDKPEDIVNKKSSYNEAENLLKEAIKLEPNQGVANCFLADILEKKGGEKPEILIQWNYCQKNADSMEDTEEARLKNLASAKIETLTQKLHQKP